MDINCFINLCNHRSPCAKFPADAVHTPDFLNRSLSSIQAMALTAGRTLNDPIG